jgi:Cd2+/Zn2+-exporting ATPase
LPGGRAGAYAGEDVFQGGARTRKKAYRVEGLDCAEEVGTLNRALKGRPGVIDLSFDILNARMAVTFDDERLSSDDIVGAVAQTGMSAVPWEEQAPGRAPFWELHGRTVMAALSGASILAGFVVHWAVSGSLYQAVASHEISPAAMVLYGIGALAGAWFVLPRAAISARELRPDMNLLMTAAVIGALAIGQWLEAAMVAFLFSVALLLEHWSVGRARRAISALLDLTPPLARVAPPDGGEPVDTPVEEVPMGSVVIVRPGERVPLDGQVLTGSSRVNQAPITGESSPVRKKKGQEVYAGTINGEGTLEIEVNRDAQDTTLARIIHMVQESHQRRAKSEQWIEKFARYYTPAMMLLAVVIAVAPPLAAGAAWDTWIYRGLVFLVIGCPCALVISTPVSIVSALTSAARNGVLIKGGMYLEAAGGLQALAMDKTGTLTYGRPEVQEVLPLDGHTPDDLLFRAASVEADSTHPLADAVLRKAAAHRIVARRAKDFRSIAGKGAEGSVNDRLYWVGSHGMMHEKGQETDEAHQAALRLEDAGHTVVAVGSEDHVCGLISVADGLRQNAAEVVAALKRLGIRQVVMLTGDNEETARSIAAATGVDEWHAGLMPEDKVAAVERLAGAYQSVAMVGDGVNDAPAMAAASFGIAMGAIGSDAAIETADITLMSDEIAKLPWLVAHSRHALGIIKQNVGFSLGVKALFIALTLMGMASLWMAIAADTGASLIVIFNGLRLLRPGAGIGGVAPQGQQQSAERSGDEQEQGG